MFVYAKNTNKKNAYAFIFVDWMLNISVQNIEILNIHIILIVQYYR